MSEREVLARLDRIESQLGKALRILEHNLEQPPPRQGRIAEPPTAEQIREWEQEGDT